ncbi:MAG: sporulation protein [Bacteroidota bacterium]
MFKKVKKWLGIEGVKLELVLPEEIAESNGQVQGKIRFLSMNDQTVDYIKVVMVERFSRGRKKEKLTDEYKMGEIVLEREIAIPKEQAITLDFTLPFAMVKSEMDDLEDRNFIFSGLVKLAKKARGVNSEFYIEAEARVKGTALNPFDKQPIVVN